jgi:mannose-6-phosphate isomerase
MTRSDSAPPAGRGYPFRLEPLFVERVWGAPPESEALSSLYPARPPDPSAPRPIGEVWLTGDDNRVASGPYAGKTLRDVARLCGPSLVGETGIRPHPSGAAIFPLLVKFLFTTDKLSVQVHPPDSYGGIRGTSWGKTEMWHILRAAAGARLAVGFRPDAAKHLASHPQALREAIAGGAIEQMLDWVEPRAGDTFFVPAGTVHAIGPGLVLCEIQQNSDITYRLYDYNRPGTDGRPRPLHVEQALDVMQWQTDAGRTAPVELTTVEGTRRCLAACPYFATERWSLEKSDQFSTRGRVQIWIGLEGIAEFEAGGQRVACSKGEVVVIPADAGSFALRPQPPCVLLRTFPPDLENDLLVPLRASGASQDQVHKVCFPMSQVPEKAAS